MDGNETSDSNEPVIGLVFSFNEKLVKKDLRENREKHASLGFFFLFIFFTFDLVILE